MSEWKEYAVEELTEPIKDTYNPTGEDDHIYIGLEHIEQEALRLNSLGHSTDVTSNKFKFQANDVLFGKLRPYFRKVVKPKFSGICSTDIWVFRAKEGFSQEFLFYFIANWDFVDTASGGEGGTRMPRADWNFLCKSRWLLPPLPEQKAIAAVLSSLDDKIDLLHRQNKTLEAMGETLFRQWFVEDAQESWIECSVSNFADHAKENVIPQNHADTLFLHYSIPAFDNERRPTFEPGREILSNKFKVLPYSILVSKLNPRTPRIWPICELSNDNSICSTEFQVIKPKSQDLFGFILFLLRSNEATDALIMAASGTSGSHQRVRPEDILNIGIKLPSETLPKKFSDLVMPNIAKMQANLSQIQTLEKLRDTLLPKLLTGEVRVEI